MIRSAATFLRWMVFALCGALLWRGAAAGESVVRLATFEYPPYLLQVDGQAQGLSAELIREAFARMKQPLAIEIYPLNRGLKLLEAEVVSGFFSIKKTPDRETRMIFTREPLFRQDYVFFSRVGGPFQFQGDFAKIAMQTIGVLASTSYGQRFDEAVRRGEFGRIVVATSYESLFRMLAAGRFDAVICSRLVGFEFLRRTGTVGLIAVNGPVVETTFSYLAFSITPEHLALARAFDQAIAQMRRDGTLASLYALYGAEPIQPSRSGQEDGP